MATTLTADGLHPERLPKPSGHRATAWWGMALLICTEASLFAYLLFGYFYLGSMSRGPWPNTPPELTLALPNTAILLLSSATMWWADRGVKRGKLGQLRLGMALTLALGVVFLA